MQTYGVHDLVLALVDARRYQHAVPELQKHAFSRYNALTRAFGLEPDELPGPSGRREDDPPRGELSELLAASLRAYERLHSPFADYLEAPPRILRLHRHHGPRLSAAYEDTRAALLDLLVDVVVLEHGLPPTATVDDDDLRDHGFDASQPAPDPDDYW
jgi:hypothetical protein